MSTNDSTRAPSVIEDEIVEQIAAEVGESLDALPVRIIESGVGEVIEEAAPSGLVDRLIAKLGGRLPVAELTIEPDRR